MFTNARIESLKGKIERQREELANLRKKKKRVAKEKLRALQFELDAYKKDNLLVSSLKADIKSMEEDNEKLRAEVVRLSGGVKSSGRSQGKTEKLQTPQTHRVVPLEATDEMLNVTYFGDDGSGIARELKYLRPHVSFHSEEGAIKFGRSLWRAMVDASQKC